jgi:predicted lipid-binding transport protein (Tim44 family)
MKFLACLLALAMLFATANAEAARRMGGGTSIGKQSGNVTKREAATPAPGQTAAAPATAPAAAPVQAPRRPWGAMLGGLAAGLGLAWLAHSLGFGEGLGQFMMVAMLVLLAMMAFGMFMRWRRGAAAQPASPFAFQGAGAGSVPVAGLPRQYNSDNVGNDASARPWERNSMAFEAMPNGTAGAGGATMIGSALSGSQNWGVPPGFDTAGFLGSAKGNFITLQDAWDRSDIPSLRAMMTDDMLTEIKAQLAEREAHVGTANNKTDVVMLNAQLLGIEDLGEAYMASVEFSGMIREEPSAGPSPFREVWNMTKPRDGSTGWLVAGVQALQ